MMTISGGDGCRDSHDMRTVGVDPTVTAPTTRAHHHHTLPQCCLGQCQCQDHYQDLFLDLFSREINLNKANTAVAVQTLS